jgi:hypothetical protein
MTLLIKLFFVLNSLQITSNPEIIAIRQQYEVADKNKENYDKLISILGVSKKLNPSTRLGYEGACEMIAAEHAINPLTKLKYFNSGKKVLETAILNDKDNIELRYLRYTLQEHSPSLLAYHGNMREDKIFLIQSISEKLKQSDNDLLERIAKNFLKSDFLTLDEKAKLKLTMGQINKQ